MARMTCPCCGNPYNGKKCKNCLYESFTETRAHGLHTHEGEPLVIQEPTRQPIPRQDPFDCGKTQKRRKAGRSLLWIPIVLALVSPLLRLLSNWVPNLNEPVRRPFADAVQVVSAPIPEGAEVIYADDSFTVWLRWADGFYQDALPVLVENRTQQDISVVAQQITVHNYLCQECFLYCDVPAGSRAGGQLYMGLEELARAGLSDPAALSFRLNFMDEDFNTITQADIFLPLPDTVAEPVAVPDSLGAPVTALDGLRVYYEGYTPSGDGDVLAGALWFYIVNGTGEPLKIYTGNAWVEDGRTVSLPMWCELPPNTHTRTQIYLYGLEELKLQSGQPLPEMTLELDAYLRGSYETMPTFTIKPR